MTRRIALISCFHQQLSLRLADTMPRRIARRIARRSAHWITRRIAHRITYWSARQTTRRSTPRSGHITSTEQVTKPRNGHAVNVAITTEKDILSVLWLPGMSPGNAG